MIIDQEQGCPLSGRPSAPSRPSLLLRTLDKCSRSWRAPWRSPAASTPHAMCSTVLLVLWSGRVSLERNSRRSRDVWGRCGLSCEVSEKNTTCWVNHHYEHSQGRVTKLLAHPPALPPHLFLVEPWLYSVQKSPTSCHGSPRFGSATARNCPGALLGIAVKRRIRHATLPYHHRQSQ